MIIYIVLIRQDHSALPSHHYLGDDYPFQMGLEIDGSLPGVCHRFSFTSSSWKIPWPLPPPPNIISPPSTWLESAAFKQVDIGHSVPTGHDCHFADIHHQYYDLISMLDGEIQWAMIIVGLSFSHLDQLLRIKRSVLVSTADGIIQIICGSVSSAWLLPHAVSVRREGEPTLSTTVSNLRSNSIISSHLSCRQRYTLLIAAFRLPKRMLSVMDSVRKISWGTTPTPAQ